MLSEEVKTTIYVGIGLLIAALVLGLISVAISLDRDLADMSNNEYYTTQSLEHFEEYSAFNQKVLYGEDVMACIANGTSKNIPIYIYNFQGLATNVSPGAEVISGYSKFNISSIDLKMLSDGVNKNINSLYFAYLVYGLYGDESIINATPSKNTIGYSDVTAIKLVYMGDDPCRVKEGFSTTVKERKVDIGKTTDNVYNYIRTTSSWRDSNLAGAGLISYS